MIHFRVEAHETFTVLHFDCGSTPLVASTLKDLSMPPELLARRHVGLVVSGRGPVWLYAFLVHWAHPFAWVATYDPRLNGAVVVARHVAEAPELGSVITVTAPEMRGDA